MGFQDYTNVQNSYEYSNQHQIKKSDEFGLSQLKRTACHKHNPPNY